MNVYKKYTHTKKKLQEVAPKLQDFESLDFNGNGYWSIFSMISEQLVFLIRKFYGKYIVKNTKNN